MLWLTQILRTIGSIWLNDWIVTKYVTSLDWSFNLKETSLCVERCVLFREKHLKRDDREKINVNEGDSKKRINRNLWNDSMSGFFFFFSYHRKDL